MKIEIFSFEYKRRSSFDIMIPRGESDLIIVNKIRTVGKKVSNSPLRIPIKETKMQMNIMGNKVNPKTLHKAYDDSRSSW